MKKYSLVIFGLLLFSRVAFCGTDWVAAKKSDPPRLYWSDGKRIEVNLIKIVHERDLDPNGWKFELLEWMKREAPRYHRDEHGSNGGYCFG